MKKNRFFILVAFALFVMLPFSVNANSSKYTVEQKKLNDYTCENLKSKQLMHLQDYDINKIVVVDENGEEYIIDFTNPGVCEKYVNDDIGEFAYEAPYEYHWEGESLYKDTYDIDSMSFLVKKRTDVAFDKNEKYFVYDDDEGFDSVDNPIEEESQNYYQNYYFILDNDEFKDDGTVYYELVKNKFDQKYLREVSLSKDSYEIGKYYILDRPNVEFVKEFELDSFFAPKDKTGLDTNLNLTKEDFNYHFELGGEKYYVFNYEGLGFSAQLIFNEDGEYQTFGKDKLFVLQHILEDSTDYDLFLVDVDSKFYIMILNNDSQIVAFIESNNNHVMFTATISNVFYLLTDPIKGTVFEIAMFEEETKFNLSFDANGGKFKDGKSTMEIADWTFSMIYTQEEPTRDGYTFKGWYVDKELKTPLLAEPSMTNVTTIYAKWEESSSSGGAGTVEPEIENPKTFDGIGTSIFMGTISLIGLAGATIYLRKKNKVRAN